MVDPRSPAGERPSPGRRPVADGGRFERQVLVAGDGFAATVTAGFLDQAGFDPVLAPVDAERARPDVLHLWAPGLAVLERLGLRRPVERVGTPVAPGDGAGTAAPDGAAPATGRSSLVAVRRADLLALFERRLGDRVRTTERAVTALDPSGASVVATFERGVDEPFDTVVTTTPHLRPGGDAGARPTTLHVWEFGWPEPETAPDGPTEAWDDAGRAAFTDPVREGTRVTLVATADARPVPAVSVAALERAFGGLFDGTGPFDALAQRRLRYGQTPAAAAASQCIGRVALVGPAARPSLPGDCLWPSLAVEDAWVLADALGYGPGDTDAALAAYGGRRRERLRAVREALADPASSTLPPCLRRLRATRRLVSGRRSAAGPHPLARDVPDRL